MRSNAILTGALLISAFAAAPAANAADCADLLPGQISKGQPRMVTAEDLARLRDVGDAAVSPDGGAVVFEILRADPATNSYCSGLYVMNLRQVGPPKRLDLGTEAIVLRGTNWGMINYPVGTPLTSVPQWSPDGRSIAFLKSVGGVIQLWTVKADGGQARALVVRPFDVEDFVWSKDSRGLVISSKPGLVAKEKAVDEEASRGFLYDDRYAPNVSPRPLPRDVPNELEIVDVLTGDTRAVTPLEASDFKSSKERGLTAARPGKNALPTDHAWFTPFTASEGKGLQVSVGRKTLRCEAAECLNGIKAVWWNQDGTEVRFLRREGWANSRSALYRWRPGTSSPVRWLATDDFIPDCAPVGDDLLCSYESSTSPRRLVMISPNSAEIRTVFEPNPEFQNIALQPAERLRWRNDRGIEVFGDLVLPAGHRPGERHPLIVVGYTSSGFLRGGVGDEYPIQLFAANGYAVLSFNRPTDIGFNPPSSDMERNLRAGIVDWSDRRSVNSALEVGIDLAISKGAVDPKRIALTGLSEGAAMTMWALVNNPRYAAASVSGLGSQMSFLSLGGPAKATGFKRYGMLGLSDPKGVEFWAQAAIPGSAQKVNAPILVQASGDEFINALDSYQSLRELEQPIEMYVFPGDHHIKWQPVHRLAVYRRNLQWFDFWLMGREDQNPLDPDQYKRWRELRAKRPSSTD